MISSMSRPLVRFQSGLSTLVFVLFTLGVQSTFAAQISGQNCNRAASKPITLVHLQGHPFEPIITRDGCWIFVSMFGSPSTSAGAVAVLRRADGKVKLVRVVHLESSPPPQAALGMVLTHDGQLLIATAGSSILFLDTGRLISGDGNPILGSISDGPEAGSIYVNVSGDDGFAFVSDERLHSITVIDLAKARRSGFAQNAIVGRIPTGNAPIALTFSPDGHYLYTTSEVALASWGWPNTCTPEGPVRNPPDRRRPEGAILVVDAVKARTDPANSVVAKVPAGCSPVRLVLSPHGRFAYVTVRPNNELAEFSTAELLTDPSHALIAAVPVGTAPVGVALVDGGSKLVVTNSNRFAGQASDRQPLTVIDTAKIPQGAAAVLGTIPAGGFPREMRVTTDGKTLLLTNFTSNTLELIALNRLPLQSKAARQ